MRYEKNGVLRCATNRLPLANFCSRSVVWFLYDWPVVELEELPPELVGGASTVAPTSGAMTVLSKYLLPPLYTFPRRKLPSVKATPAIAKELQLNALYCVILANALVHPAIAVGAGGLA